MERPVQKILKDEGGALIIAFALMINTIILAVALSMDMGRAYMASSAIAGAADAAAVASAIAGGDDTRAEVYFTGNLTPGALGIDYDYARNVDHVVDPDAGTVSVRTNGFEVDSFFSAGANASSALNVGGGNIVGLMSETFLPADYFFIIDASGSMSGSAGNGFGNKANAVRISIENFVKLLFGAQSSTTYQVSLTNYRTQGTGKDSPTLSGSIQSHPLYDDPQVITGYLPGLVSPSGSTCGGCGLRDAYDRIQQDIAQNSSLDRNRVVIFMTDGMFNNTGQPDRVPENAQTNMRYTDYEPSNYAGANLQTAHRYVVNMCTDIKAVPNTSIWSVRFGSGANSGQNRAAMDFCASAAEQSIYAADGDALNKAFSEIAKQTGRIRILQ